jgi:hypothetical protein
MKMTVFWDVAPCTVVGIDRRFTGAYCLHQQGDECNACLVRRLSYYLTIIPFLGLFNDALSTEVFFFPATEDVFAVEGRRRVLVQGNAPAFVWSD